MSDLKQNQVDDDLLADDFKDSSSSVDEILDEPGVGFSEGFDLLKKHSRVKGGKPVDISDLDEQSLEMLRKSGKSDPQLAITVLKRGFASPALGDLLAGKSMGGEKKTMASSSQRGDDDLDDSDGGEGKGLGYQRGSGDWTYKRSSGGYEIVGAPEEHKGKVGMVVKPGMKGYDAIDKEMSAVS